MVEITIYSTRQCPECQQAKAFLTKNNIRFSEVDVTSDVAKQQEMIILTGGHRRVPVIAIDNGGHDKEVLLGFNPETLRKILDRTSST
jgi:glutaredoxin